MKRLIQCVVAALLVAALPAFRAVGQDESDGLPSELVVAMSKSDIQLNPMLAFTATEAQLFTALYEGLVTYNPFTLEPVPGVAKSWEISPDGKTYVFHLREDARYWDGQPVTANDFRDSWLKLLNPKEKAPYSFLLDIVKGAKAYRLGEDKNPASVGIKVLDPHTLEVDLTEPATDFLKILCHYAFVPIPKPFLSVKDWSAQPTVPGNGPFYILKHNADEIILEKNQLYWDADHVKLSSIKILLTNDAEKVTTLFNEGKIQWAAGNADWNKVKNTKSIVVNPLFATSYFYFNCRQTPWSNAEVRRALALLLPWDRIRVPNQLYIPATTLVPRIGTYPDVTGITKQDIPAAMALLAQAGFVGGKGLPTVTIAVPEGGESQRVAEVMAKAWRSEIGLEVDIKTYSYNAYYDAVQSAPFTLATTTWIGDFADPLTFLQMWTSDSNLNGADYRNPAYDRLIKESIGQPESERYKTMADAETMLLSQAPVLPIDHTPAVNLINLSTIDGWYPNPLDIHPFKYMEWRAPEPIPGAA